MRLAVRTEVPMERPDMNHVAVVGFPLGTVPTAEAIDHAVDAIAERLRAHIRRHYGYEVTP